MRKLYKEFFYISKHEKIREKVMLTRVVTTIAIMVFCLAAMGITAYAYFSYNVTSDSNIIKAASFETKVQVQITDSDGKAVDNGQITPITSDHKKFRIEGLEVGKWYTVTIAHTEQSTAKSGFVVVTADNCPTTYHTQQLAKDVNAEGGQTPSISFKLMITDTTNVYLLAHWGTSSYYGYPTENNELYILNGEEVTLSIIGATNENSSTNNKDSTTSETGSATTTESATSSAYSVESSTPSTEANQSSEAVVLEPTETSELTDTAEPDATQSADSNSAETIGNVSTEQTPSEN